MSKPLKLLAGFIAIRVVGINKMDLKVSYYVSIMLCVLMVVSTHICTSQECSSIEVDVSMTENCSSDATDILSVDIRCRSNSVFLIWNSDLFQQELAITAVSSDHTFMLRKPDLQVTDNNSFEDSCLQSTLTFSGPNLRLINDHVISCRADYEETFLLITLPNYIETIIELAACGHTLQNCSSSQNSAVNVNLTVDGRSMDYEVFAPVNFTKPSDNCTKLCSSACAVLDVTCNKTIMVSTSPKFCEGELKYILSSADTQQFVNVGNSFFLDLTLENPSGTPYNFSWTKNQVHYLKNVTGTSIYIPMTNLNDAGIYNVIATSNSSTTSASFTLIILCAPEFEDSTPTLNVTEGENFTIACNTTNFCPLPTNITLEVSTENSFETMFFDLGQNVQQFPFATLNSSGNYTCVASNEYNTTTFVHQVQVINSSIPDEHGIEITIIAATVGTIGGLLLIIGLTIGTIIVGYQIYRRKSGQYAI